jgi:hypothetical protein
MHASAAHSEFALNTELGAKHAADATAVARHEQPALYAAMQATPNAAVTCAASDLISGINAA